MKEFILVLLAAATLSAAAPKPAEEKEVMSAINAWIEATVNQDIPALEKFLHEELAYTHSSAKTQTKADVIADVKEGRGPAGIEFSDTKIHVYDKTAVVRSMVTVRGRSPNPSQSATPAPSPLLITHVLVKGSHGWQLVSRQATRPAPPAASTPTR